MNATNRGMTGIKAVRYALLGSATLLVCAILLPMGQGSGFGGLMAKASNLIVPPAFADDNKSSNESSGNTSSSTDCLICVDVSTISSSAFGSTSGSKSEGESDSSTHKVSMCHSAGNSGHHVTLSIDSSAVPAHLKQGDSYGACSNTIPTCAALTGSGTVIGIWVPSSAVGNDTALNTYFSDIQAGTSSSLQACAASNATQTYQDIHGQ